MTIASLYPMPATACSLAYSPAVNGLRKAYMQKYAPNAAVTVHIDQKSVRSVRIVNSLTAALLLRRFNDRRACEPIKKLPGTPDSHDPHIPDLPSGAFVMSIELCMAGDSINLTVRLPAAFAVV